jgi:hypothetical protein
MMEIQMQDLRNYNATLQSMVNQQVIPKPEVCFWENIKPHMKVIAKRLILGSDSTRNRPFPREEQMKETILDAFNVSATDTNTRRVFE